MKRTGLKRFWITANLKWEKKGVEEVNKDGAIKKREKGKREEEIVGGEA